VLSSASELNSVVASTSTRVSRTSSVIRHNVRMKKVVTKTMATPRQVAMVPLMLRLVDDDMLVPGFHDDLETLHLTLTVRDDKVFVPTMLIGVEMVVIWCQSLYR